MLIEEKTKKNSTLRVYKLVYSINMEAINALITIICRLFIRKPFFSAGLWHIHVRFTMNISGVLLYQGVRAFTGGLSLRNCSFSQPAICHGMHS